MEMGPETTTNLFDRLKYILNRYEVYFKVIEDTPEAYILHMTPRGPLEQETLFAGVKSVEDGVVYQLTPVEMFETISNPLSPALKEHMQGDSSFHFTEMEEDLFQQLEALTQLSVNKLKIEGMV